MQQVEAFKTFLQRETGSPGWTYKNKPFYFSFFPSPDTKLWGWNAYAMVNLSSEEKSFYSLYQTGNLQTKGFATRKEAINYLQAVYTQITGDPIQIDKLNQVKGTRYTYPVNQVQFTKCESGWLVSNAKPNNSILGIDAFGKRAWVNSKYELEYFSTLNQAISAYINLK